MTIPYPTGTRFVTCCMCTGGRGKEQGEGQRGEDDGEGGGGERVAMEELVKRSNEMEREHSKGMHELRKTHKED